MSSHPKTYRVAQISKKGGDFEIVEREWKDPQEGEIVVKVEACGICHSDHIVQAQIMPTGLPRVPGHEIIGKVAAVPSSEKRFKVGDRVGSGWHGSHCGICRSCRKGDFITCENEGINGILTDGGYGEYVTLRTEALAAIPDDIDAAEAAPLLCAGVTTFNSLRNMSIQPGEVCAVQGLGGLGHLAVQFSKKMGFKTVALSTSAAKEKLAMDLGADIYVDGSKEDHVEALQKLGGAKVIVAVAPSAKAMSSLIPALAVDGQLIVLAVDPASNLDVPIFPMIQKRLQVRGWPSGTAQDSEETIEFAQNAGVKCAIEKFTLDQVNEGFAKMTDNKVRFRAVLVFE